MKSVFGTFLIFIVIFGLMKMNIIGVLNSTVFHFISYAALLTVICCAVYFVGMPSLGKKDKDNIGQSPQERLDKDEN